MKLRSLFLAGIAAFAMASCSNEEEFITNNDGAVGTEEASVQFGIAFSANGTSVRATENGDITEQKFTDATIVIEQGGSNSVMTFPIGDFEHTENTMLWLKKKIAVKEGAANVYVFLNASDALKAKLSTDATSEFSGYKTSVAFSGTMKQLAETGNIAEANHFLMCNATGKPEATTFTKETTNQLSVKVSRVAAKLEEMTLNSTEEYDVTDNATNLSDKKITVKLIGHTYAGLQQNTYVLKNSTPLKDNLYNPYNGATTAYTFQTIGNDKISNYCMENLAVSNENLNTTTNIIYKGKVKVEGVTEGTTIYITADNKFFSSIPDMVAAGYKYDGLDEDTSVADCWNTYSLRKYEDGICYYIAPIKTTATNKAEIVRNNIYRLSVNSITGIGSVLPETLKENTLLDLTVEEEPWTVNLNSFDL